MTRTILTIAIPAFLILSQLPAQAGPNDRQGGVGKGAGQGMREEMRKRFDQNGDGKLAPQELAAARQAMQARGKDRPANGGPGKGDGANRDAVLKRFDKDGDGKLNDQERAAARKAMEERRNKN